MINVQVYLSPKTEIRTAIRRIPGYPKDDPHIYTELQFRTPSGITSISSETNKVQEFIATLRNAADDLQRAYDEATQEPQ